MFNNKNDPLLDSVKKVMELNESIRKAQDKVSAEFGVYSRAALPIEQREQYDRRVDEVLNEGKEQNLSEGEVVKLKNKDDSRFSHAMGMGDFSDEDKAKIAAKKEAKAKAKGKSAEVIPMKAKTVREESDKHEYSKSAVDKEIKKDKRIKGREAKAIHALLRGRQKSDEPTKLKEDKEKKETALQKAYAEIDRVFGPGGPLNNETLRKKRESGETHRERLANNPEFKAWNDKPENKKRAENLRKAAKATKGVSEEEQLDEGPKLRALGGAIRDTLGSSPTDVAKLAGGLALVGAANATAYLGPQAAGMGAKAGLAAGAGLLGYDMIKQYRRNRKLQKAAADPNNPNRELDRLQGEVDGIIPSRKPFTGGKKSKPIYEERLDEAKRPKGKNWEQVHDEYLDNEDNNAHTENAVMLAKHFGTPEEKDAMKRLHKEHMRRGSLPTDMKSEVEMRGNIDRKYYSKLVDLADKDKAARLKRQADDPNKDEREAAVKNGQMDLPLKEQVMQEIANNLLAQYNAIAEEQNEARLEAFVSSLTEEQIAIMEAGGAIGKAPTSMSAQERAAQKFKNEVSSAQNAPAKANVAPTPTPSMIDRVKNYFTSSAPTPATNVRATPEQMATAKADAQAQNRNAENKRTIGSVKNTPVSAVPSSIAGTGADPNAKSAIPVAAKMTPAQKAATQSVLGNRTNTTTPTPARPAVRKNVSQSGAVPPTTKAATGTPSTPVTNNNQPVAPSRQGPTKGVPVRTAIRKVAAKRPMRPGVRPTPTANDTFMRGFGGNNINEALIDSIKKVMKGENE